MNNNNTGLIIANLGSPESPDTPDVKKYLDEFLMDGKVIDMPYLSRFLLVRGIITPTRSPKSAAAYKTIWTDKGSPLTVITNEFGKLLQEKINVPLEVAMRYGNPTPSDALKRLLAKAPGLKSLLIWPMYPHYAMSSYETALEHIKEAVKRSGKDLQIKTLKPFYNEPGYISALADSIKTRLNEGIEYDKILFSYHGLPVRHLKKSDPTHTHCYSSDACCEIKSSAWDYCYKHQVKTTTRLVTEQLRLPTDKVILTFQSRLGSGWIQPFTDIRLTELPKEGVKKILVICPAFVADCLETLEEINDRGRHTFIENGGEVFNYVPCLNTTPGWVDTVARYCNGHDSQYSSLWM